MSLCSLLPVLLNPFTQQTEEEERERRGHAQNQLKRVMERKVAGQQRLKKWGRLPANVLWFLNPISLPDPSHPSHTLLSLMEAIRAH